MLTDLPSSYPAYKYSFWNVSERGDEEVGREGEGEGEGGGKVSERERERGSEEEESKGAIKIAVNTCIVCCRKGTT